MGKRPKETQWRDKKKKRKEILELSNVETKKGKKNGEYME